VVATISAEGPNRAEAGLAGSGRAEAGQVRAHADDVARCAPSALWAVEEYRWTELVPTLPEETIALLAPPVVVTAEPCDVRLTYGPRHAR
jgi:hypothetical protein